MHSTNPDSLRGCLCFRVFRFSFAFDFCSLLLVRFHRVWIIIISKHLIPGATTGLGWELNHQPCDRDRRKNDATNVLSQLFCSFLTSCLTQNLFLSTCQWVNAGPCFSVLTLTPLPTDECVTKSWDKQLFTKLRKRIMMESLMRKQLVSVDWSCRT